LEWTSLHRRELLHTSSLRRLTYRARLREQTLEEVRLLVLQELRVNQGTELGLTRATAPFVASGKKWEAAHLRDKCASLTFLSTRKSGTNDQRLLFLEQSFKRKSFRGEGQSPSVTLVLDKVKHLRRLLRVQGNEVMLNFISVHHGYEHRHATCLVLVYLGHIICRTVSQVKR
jgi:hypothetical protein